MNDRLRYLFSSARMLGMCGLVFLFPLLMPAQTNFWQRGDGGFGEGDATQLAVNASGHIFVGTNLGIYRTTNSGASWDRVTAGIISALAIHPNGDVYAGECSGSESD